MSSERIKQMQERGYAMGSCTAYALVAVGFNIPPEMFEFAIEVNRKRFAEGDLNAPSDDIVLGLSGYYDWTIRRGSINNGLDLKRTIINSLDNGSRVMAKVDYGDGRNSHLIGICDYSDNDILVIGGDLRFIGCKEEYIEVSLSEVYKLMTRNRNRNGGSSGDIFIIEKIYNENDK